MAKQVIILGVSQSSDQLSVRYVMWFPITSGLLSRTGGSAWIGASSAENLALQNGSVVEEGGAREFPLGTTTSAIKDILVKEWTNRNQAIGGVGQNTYNGVYFDSVSGWSA